MKKYICWWTHIPNIRSIYEAKTSGKAKYQCLKDIQAAYGYGTGKFIDIKARVSK